MLAEHEALCGLLASLDGTRAGEVVTSPATRVMADQFAADPLPAPAGTRCDLSQRRSRSAHPCIAPRSASWSVPLLGLPRGAPLAKARGRTGNHHGVPLLLVSWEPSKTHRARFGFRTGSATNK